MSIATEPSRKFRESFDAANEVGQSIVQLSPLHFSIMKIQQKLELTEGGNDSKS